MCKSKDGRLLNLKENILNTWMGHFDYPFNGMEKHMEHNDLGVEEIPGSVGGYL